MHRVSTFVSRLPLLILALATLSVAAFGQSNSGSITLQGTASGYVEVRAGGAASVSGGGTISNNKAKGDQLDNPSVLTIDFGEVSPANTNAFVSATVPLRLRSNVSYTLKMTAGAMSYGSGTPDANSVTLADVGFGVTSATRDSGGGVASGTDTIASGSGDPTSGSNGATSGSTGRYVYNSGFSLGDYSSATTLLTGPRVMQAAVPTGSTNGLVVNTVFAVKPQFFTPGSFSTSVTFTISNP
ncbi:MAG TPA: hypothetical protein VKA60_26810 [Blastocatellia bacterium]|nr:hypothetical protein [Blastocatellia bacterium]